MNFILFHRTSQNTCKILISHFVEAVSFDYSRPNRVTTRIFFLECLLAFLAISHLASSERLLGGFLGLLAGDRLALPPIHRTFLGRAA